MNGLNDGEEVWRRKPTEVKAQRRPSSRVCLSVQPQGDKWLNGFTGRVSQTQPCAPSDIFPLRQIKEESETPPVAGRRWVDGRGDKVKKASERVGREKVKEKTERDRGREWGQRQEGRRGERGGEMRGTDATGKRKKKKTAKGSEIMFDEVQFGAWGRAVMLRSFRINFSINLVYGARVFQR